MVTNQGLISRASPPQQRVALPFDENIRTQTPPPIMPLNDNPNASTGTVASKNTVIKDPRRVNPVMPRGYNPNAEPDDDINYDSRNKGLVTQATAAQRDIGYDQDPSVTAPRNTFETNMNTTVAGPQGVANPTNSNITAPTNTFETNMDSTVSGPQGVTEAPNTTIDSVTNKVQVDQAGTVTDLAKAEYLKANPIVAKQSGFKINMDGTVSRIDDVATRNGNTITATENKFQQADLTQTGVGRSYRGSSYSGRGSGEIVDETSSNLNRLLEEDSEYMQLARAQGSRQAEARGLGGSSLRGRAAQGAAIASAMPIVQQGTDVANQQFISAQNNTAQSNIAAQNNTAQSNIAASNRQLQELLAQQDIAARMGDNEAARDLQAQIQNESNNIEEYKAQIQTNSAQNMQLQQLKLTELLEQQSLAQRDGNEQANRELQAQIENERNKLDAFTVEAGINSNQDMQAQRLKLDELLKKKEMALATGNADADRELTAQIKNAEMIYSAWESATSIESNEFLQTEQMKLNELLTKYQTNADQGNNEANRELQADIESQRNIVETWKTATTVESNEFLQTEQLKLTEMLTKYETNAEQGNNEANRELQADIETQRNKIETWKTTTNLESNEYMQFQQFEQSDEQAALDRELQKNMQGIDIDYRKWLEQTTFEHQGILQGNQQASTAYNTYTEAATNILNNPETSSAQKSSSVRSLQTGLTDQLELISLTAGIDLSEFLSTAGSVGNFEQRDFDGPFAGGGAGGGAGRARGRQGYYG